MKQVILMVGPSGSGKSTKAREYAETNPGTVVVSADNFFVNDKGDYHFVAALLHQAHSHCFDEFMKALQNPEIQTVIVDNTNTRHREREAYVKAAKAMGVRVFLWVIEADPEVCAQRNVHGVPKETVERQQSRIDVPVGFQEV